MLNTLTLAEKLGTATRVSRLLRKAAGLGLTDAAALEALAVARGCWHYREPQMSETARAGRAEFSNEELAIALLSPNHPYSPHTIRLGAAMLAADGNDAERLAVLSQEEGCELVVRHIATAGIEFEPENPLWRELLAKLPLAGQVADGVLPHPTRFISMTGITRAGVGRVAVWIRPRTDLVLAHG